MKVSVTVTHDEIVTYGTQAIQALFPNSTVSVVVEDTHAAVPIPVSPPPTTPSVTPPAVYAPGHAVTGNPPYSVTGSATLFGLNYDGSVDTGDNGEGFFTDPATGTSYKTANKTLRGASLPREVMLTTFLGVSPTSPIDSIWSKHAYALKAYVTANKPLLTIDSRGKTSVDVPLVDAGPTAATGNALDLTYAVSHELGTEGKATATYEIRVDGVAIEIKNWPITA